MGDEKDGISIKAIEYLFSKNQSGWLKETEGVFNSRSESIKMFEKYSSKTNKVDLSGLPLTPEKTFGVGDVIRGILKSQSGKDSGTYPGEFIKLEDGMNLFFNKTTNQLSSLKGIISNFLSKSFQQVTLAFEEQSDLLTEINTKTGLTGKLSEGFRANIIETSVYAAGLEVSFGDLSESMSKILVDSGRFKIMSSETMNKIVLMSKVGFDNMTEAAQSVSEFQKVSMGASDAMEAVNKTVTSSLQLGLNAKVTTKDLTANIGKLNTYGFKDGIEGLRKMVQQAQALKMDLNESFKLAEKVMDPTDALSLSANLQVIGGALGDFNDPIKMMWMATNNVEGLQDALVGSLESLTTFDEKSGTFKIVGADLRRARAMADQFGMSLQEASNLAIQAAQRTSAATDMMSSGLVFDNEEDKEFLTNLAQMKNGKMVIEVPEDLKRKFGSTDIVLEKLTSGQKDDILAMREQFKKLNATDIAEQQVNAIKNIERLVSYLAARGRAEVGNRVYPGVNNAVMEQLNTLKGYKNLIEKGIITSSDELENFIKTMFSAGKNEILNLNQNNKPKALPVPVEPTQKEKPLPPVPTKEVSEKNITVSFNSDATMDTFKRAAYNEWLINSPDAKSYLFNEA
jgi:hypothetical protein